jgi:uncharacterized iron-regulated membrane protein
MKHISIWAKKHKTSARWFIVFLYLPLNILAIYNGMLLSDIELQLGSSFLYTTVLCILLLFLLYRSNASYFRRKSMHFLMAVCTYFLVLFAGNQVNTPKPQFPFFETVNAVEQAPLLSKVNNREAVKFKPSVKQYKKELRKIARNETKKTPQWVKILLTVLVVVVAAGLMYVLAALACTIACNGSEALAWIVFLAGSAGIVFGAVRIIQWIFGRKRKKRKQEANPN